MRRKHILLIVENNSVPRDPRVWNEALAAKEAGYDVTVLCPRDNRGVDTAKTIDGIRVFRHPFPIEGRGVIGLLLEYAVALVMEVAFAVWIYLTKPFHCVHVSNPPDHLFLVALPFKLAGVRFIFDHHDISPENYLAKFNCKGSFYHLLRFMEWLSFKSADMVISTNESYRTIALQRGGKRPETVAVVRNGPDLSRLPNPTPDESLRAGFGYLVGYVGVIGQQEGIENLLEAVRYITADLKRTDIRFIVMGTGPHLKHLIQLSGDLGLEKYVWFTGYVSREMLHRVLSTVDLCVNPEFGNEFTDRSTMIKVMEYMAYSKPIVQFHTTEGEVTASDAAVYIRDNDVRKFAEKIVHLLDDESKRARMARVGRERIENDLSWDRQKLALKRVYASLVGTPARRYGMPVGGTAAGL